MQALQRHAFMMCLSCYQQKLGQMHNRLATSKLLSQALVAACCQLGSSTGPAAAARLQFCQGFLVAAVCWRLVELPLALHWTVGGSSSGSSAAAWLGLLAGSDAWQALGTAGGCAAEQQPAPLEFDLGEAVALLAAQEAAPFEAVYGALQHGLEALAGADQAAAAADPATQQQEEAALMRSLQSVLSHAPVRWTCLESAQLLYKALAKLTGGSALRQQQQRPARLLVHALVCGSPATFLDRQAPSADPQVLLPALLHGLTPCSFPAAWLVARTLLDEQIYMSAIRCVRL